MCAIGTSPAKKKDATGGDIAVDLYPFIREYKGGRVERFLRSSFVPASEDNRGVATKDVVIDKSTGVSARLFLASRTAAAAAAAGDGDGAGGGQRLPVIVYIHGGSFCTESAFCRTYNNYAKSLAARTGALVVSVEYRLAPEHPIPAAYDDAWAALQWVASLSDPWLADYADPERMFLAGDSAGGNIAYHTAVRAASSSLMDIEGLVIVHPYFWGSDRLASETAWDGVAMFPPDLVDRLWPFVTAGHAGNDDPRINPPEEEIASLTCRRMLVAVAEKNSLRDRGRQLAARMRDCGHHVALVESEGEDHGENQQDALGEYSAIRESAAYRLATAGRFAPGAASMRGLWPFVTAGHAGNDDPRFNPPEEEIASRSEMNSSQPIHGVPARPYIDIFGYGMAMKDWSGQKSMPLHTGQGKTSKTRYGLVLGGTRPNKTNMVSLSAAASSSSTPGSSIFYNIF